MDTDAAPAAKGRAPHVIQRSISAAVTPRQATAAAAARAVDSAAAAAARRPERRRRRLWRSDRLRTQRSPAEASPEIQKKTNVQSTTPAAALGSAARSA
jgi:hypothetical protein